MKAGSPHLGWGLVPLLVVSWLIPPQGGPSPTLVPQLFTLGSLGVLMLYAAWLPRKTSEMEMGALLAGGWLVAALLSATIGLLQYFGVSHSYGFISAADAGEAYGNLRQRNQFATLTNMGLMAVLWWAEQPVLSRHIGIRPWVLQAAAFLFATANAASMSRTGLVQLLLTVTLMLYWKLQDWDTRRVLIASALGYVLASLMLPLLGGIDFGYGGIVERFRAAGDVCTSRLTMWRNVLHLIGQKPWLGWGWGELDYAHFVSTYESPRFCELLDNAHNLPLQLAVELGIPMALLACGALLGLIFRGQPWRKKNPNHQLAWGILMLIFLHSMLEYPLWYGPFQMSLVMCLVLLYWPEIEKMPGKRHGTSRRIARIGFVHVGACLVAFALYAAWDYHRISQIYRPPEQRSATYREETLEKIRGSWLFKDQVRFAEYAITPLTQNNAQELYAMGLLVLHYSPEARVVEKLIECTVVLGLEEETRFYVARYKAAYPQRHARWAAKQLEPVRFQ